MPGDKESTVQLTNRDVRTKRKSAVVEIQPLFHLQQRPLARGWYSDPWVHLLVSLSAFYLEKCLPFSQKQRDLHGVDDRIRGVHLEGRRENRTGSHLTELRCSIPFFQFACRKRLLFERIQVLSKIIVPIVTLSE